MFLKPKVLRRQGARHEKSIKSSWRPNTKLAVLLFISVVSLDLIVDESKSFMDLRSPELGKFYRKMVDVWVRDEQSPARVEQQEFFQTHLSRLACSGADEAQLVCCCEEERKCASSEDDKRIALAHQQWQPADDSLCSKKPLGGSRKFPLGIIWPSQQRGASRVDYLIAQQMNFSLQTNN